MPWRRRVLTYRESGGIRFTQAERQAYSIMVDLRIISRVGSPSLNLRSNPPISFWGKWTLFGGSVPAMSGDMIFPRQRILNFRNERRADLFDQLSIAGDQVEPPRDVADVVSVLAFAVDGLALAPSLGLPFNYLKFVGLPGSQFEVTIWKLNFEEGDDVTLPDPVQDPTRNDDQYYEPQVNPPEDPFAGNPDPSAEPTNVDPRDFSPENQPGENTGTGEATFEFTDENLNGFEPFSQQAVGYPGQLVSGVTAEGLAFAGWRDVEGVTPITITSTNGPVVIRDFSIALPDGGTYSPFNDGISSPDT